MHLQVNIQNRVKSRIRFFRSPSPCFLNVYILTMSPYDYYCTCLCVLRSFPHKDTSHIELRTTIKTCILTWLSFSISYHKPQWHYETLRIRISGYELWWRRACILPIKNHRKTILKIQYGLCAKYFTVNKNYCIFE